MNGRVAKAKSTIDALDARRRTPDVESSFMQRWLLWKADVLMASGLRAEARLAGLRAVEGNDFRLEARDFAGPFARWVAIVGQGGTLLARAKEVLSGLEARLAEFDADGIDWRYFVRSPS